MRILFGSLLLKDLDMLFQYSTFSLEFDQRALEKCMFFGFEIVKHKKNSLQSFTTFIVLSHETVCKYCISIILKFQDAMHSQ